MMDQMDWKPEDAETRVKKARFNLENLRRHYAQFKEYAKRFEHADSPIKGISVAVDGDDLILGYLDRKIRIWLDFDRQHERGLIVVDDVTRQGPQKPPIRIGVLSFDYSGATEIDGGFLGGTYQLSQAGDVWNLSMAFIDAALDVKLSHGT